MSRVSLQEVIERLEAMGAQLSVGPPLEISGIVSVEHIHPFTTPKDKRRPGKWGNAGAEAGSHTVLAGELPPWGQMDDALWADLMPLIPLDWRLSDSEWWKWLTALVDDIGSLIWPKYAPGAWSDATVGRILDADFALLKELRHYIGYPIKSVSPTIVQHGDFFKEEDDTNIAFGSSYKHYDPTLPAQVSECLPTVLTAGIVDKVGSLDLLLKLVFQRPRAYQVAFLQGRKGFTYQSAASANSPSLVSGHCLQASLAGCTAFAAFRNSMTPDSIELLKQFTVDVGDRRVFAGVHYPSDNLSSWYTALQLVPYVFDEQLSATIKAFLWEAINIKSVVFDAIKKHATNPDSPYRRPVEAIQSIAN
jgi:hypothetical protein